MRKLAIIKEFFQYIFARKKWWLAPVILILLLLGGLIILTEGSVIAPFLYALY